MEHIAEHKKDQTSKPIAVTITNILAPKLSKFVLDDEDVRLFDMEYIAKHTEYMSSRSLAVAVGEYLGSKVISEALQDVVDDIRDEMIQSQDYTSETCKPKRVSIGR